MYDFIKLERKERSQAFRVDYSKMKSMFAEEVIEFDVIIEELQMLENKLNG